MGGLDMALASGRSSVTRTSLTGGCLCGSVRYESAAPVSEATFCHCQSCRRASGAVALPWVTVPRTALRWNGRNTPASYASSPGVTRHFCAGCGTPLAYANDASPTTLDLTIGSLDLPQAHAPVDHIWMEDALPWDRPGDALPRHPRTRPEHTPSNGDTHEHA
jgi:hypothetical protein